MQLSGSETSSTQDTSHPALLMSEASKTCDRATSTASRSVTSSPASGVGALHCESPAFRTPPRSGPAVHPAKTTQLRLQFMDDEPDLRGRAQGLQGSGSNSSVPAYRPPSPLKTSQASRRGLPRSRDVWRALATPYPHPNDRLPVLVQRICAGACGFLPTVVARDYRSPGNPDHPRQLATRGQPLPEVLGLRLSADIARWMMGFPNEWAQCMPMATQSTRGRRQPRF